MTPEKIALTLALGTALGVSPALGCTTALCAIAAIVLRLNLPIIQTVNYLVYPLQIVLLLPFFHLGEKLFHQPHLLVSVAQIHALIHESVWLAIRVLWTAAWHAAVGWLLIAPVFIAITYAILVRVLRRIRWRQKSPAETV